MEDVVIRFFEPKDRAAVRAIAWQTAFMGEPASVFFEDEEILCDFLTLYFTDYQPHSCFVAESKGRVVGYIIGALEASFLSRTVFFRIFCRLLIKALIRGTFCHKKNLVFLGGVLTSFFKGELWTPDFSKEYPATLHINLDESMRRQGVGLKLMTAFLGYLKEKGVSGVHMATMSEVGASFFKKTGFWLLYQSRRSYFKSVLGRDISVAVFGKKIS